MNPMPMVMFPVSGEQGGMMLWALYQAHHFVTFCTYCGCLASHRLAGIGCMGLVFEAPVFFLNIREFAVIFDVDLQVCAARNHVLFVTMSCDHRWICVCFHILTAIGVCELWALGHHLALARYSAQRALLPLQCCCDLRLLSPLLP